MNPSEPSVQKLLRDSANRLRDAGIDTPIMDAELLLVHAAGLSRTRLMTHPEFVPPADDIRLFLEHVERRAGREPLAYITGEREFCGLTFEVTPDVLIPRQETEILVETVVEWLAEVENPLVADIGLGSGAIAVAIAKMVPSSIVFGTDISASALETAIRNASRNGVRSQVRFVDGDLLQPLHGVTFDLIVSNPPYIPSSDIEELQPEVAEFEPRGALDGGPDGLAVYRRLALDAPSFLREGGMLAVEIGIGEADGVSELFQAQGFLNIAVVPDYAGISRVVTATKG